MNFNTYLDSKDARVEKYVNEVIKKANAHQSEFQLVDKQGTVENQQIQDILNETEKISHTRVEASINQIIGNNKSIIITDKPFDDNWFSHHTDNFWIASVSDWENVYAPPHMDKYLQYQIIQFFAYCGAGLNVTQMNKNVHIDTTDCLFDFCLHKSDIKISMRTGRICENCERTLREFGFSDEQFHALNILIKIMTDRAKFDKVFIVHGHGNDKETVARFIESIKLKPIILSEQPDSGKTIIEKFEKCSDVDFAIVLYTPDDIGGVKTSEYDEMRPRARQNVVFEHGYFTAKFGRENVIVLLKNDNKNIETAGDNDGILYVPFDEYGGWKENIRQTLRLSGYMVNT